MFWKITFHEVATCFAMSIFFSIFRGHYLHDSSNSTSVCGLNIIWPFGDDRRAITNYNNNLIFAKNDWFWFLGHIFRASLGMVYFCIADLTALIFEVRTERRGGRSDISGLQNILLGNCWGYAWIVSIIQTYRWGQETSKTADSLCRFMEYVQNWYLSIFHINHG